MKNNMEQQFYKGDRAYYEVDKGMFMEVEVLEVDPKFGYPRYVIKPVAGKGQKLVVNLIKKDEKEITNN